MAISYQSTESRGYDNTLLNPYQTLPKPAGTVEGNLLIITGYRNNAETDNAIVLPAGFTEIVSLYEPEGGSGIDEYNGAFFIVGYRVTTAADDLVSSYDISLALTGSTSSIENWYSTLTRFTGIDTNNPIGVSSIDADTTGTNKNLSGLNPTAENSVFMLGLVELSNNETVDTYDFATDNPTWSTVIEVGTTSGIDARSFIAFSSPRAQSSNTGQISIDLDAPAAAIFSAIEIRAVPPIDIQMDAAVISLSGESSADSTIPMSAGIVELTSGNLTVGVGVFINVDLVVINLIGPEVDVDISGRWTNSNKHPTTFSSVNKSANSPFTPQPKLS